MQAQQQPQHHIGTANVILKMNDIQLSSVGEFLQAILSRETEKKGFALLKEPSLHHRK